MTTFLTMTFDSNGRASVVLFDDDGSELWSGGTTRRSGVSRVAAAVSGLIDAETRWLGNGSRHGVPVLYDAPVGHRLGPVEIADDLAQRVIAAVDAANARDLATDRFWSAQQQFDALVPPPWLAPYVASSQFDDDCAVVGADPAKMRAWAARSAAEYERRLAGPDGGYYRRLAELQDSRVLS